MPSSEPAVSGGVGDAAGSGSNRASSSYAEFRANAVHRVTDGAEQTRAVAAELGISHAVLVRWIRADRPAFALSPTSANATTQSTLLTPVVTPITPLPPAADDDRAPSAASAASHVGDGSESEPPPLGAPPGSDVLRGDDVFPRLSALLPSYRFPIILALLGAAIFASTFVPAEYPWRGLVLSLHIVSLVIAFGPILAIDWHGLLWLFGLRRLGESTRLAAAVGPLIWGGLGGLIVTGALLHPSLDSPLTVLKLVLVLAVGWNGAAMSTLRRRLGKLPIDTTRANIPIRDWRLMMLATTISQIGWWGAIGIGLFNSQT